MRVEAGLAKILSQEKQASQAGNPNTITAPNTTATQIATEAATEASKVAAEFETLFMDLVVKGLRQTAKPQEESNAQDIFTGMLDQEYTKVMTGSREFGIKSLILDWMKTVDPKLAEKGRLAAGSSEAQEALKVSRSGLDAYKAMSTTFKAKP
jgi:Rod binding domain-containing protein